MMKIKKISRYMVYDVKVDYYSKEGDPKIGRTGSVHYDIIDTNATYAISETERVFKSGFPDKKISVISALEKEVISFRYSISDKNVFIEYRCLNRIF